MPDKYLFALRSVEPESAPLSIDDLKRAAHAEHVAVPKPIVVSPSQLEMLREVKYG